MKKTTGFMLAILMTVSLTNIYSQDCVSCVDNTVGVGKYANAMGRNNNATGYYSSAIGRYNQATGNASLAFGFTNISQGNYSVAIGSYIQTGSIRSMVIGAGHSTNNKLINNYGSSLMVGFNSDVPTFFVGGSSGTGKTGKVCIGNINTLPNGPQAKLHLRADDGEDAAIFIEPNNWGSGDTASLVLGNTTHGLSANTAVGLVFRTQKYYLFNSGLIGINTTRPTYDLDVKGSIFAERFTLFDEQSPPREGSVLQCDKGGNAYWNDATGLYIWQLNENNEDIYYTTGNVSIGTDQAYPDYKLAVKGKIISEEVTVRDFIKWPDFVFGDNYQLENLKSIENYINKNNHLPGVPTALEVKKEGINLGEMNAVLLQKIEELTLYTIKQQRMIEKQFEMMESQQEQINKLNRLVND